MLPQSAVMKLVTHFLKVACSLLFRTIVCIILAVSFWFSKDRDHLQCFYCISSVVFSLPAVKEHFIHVSALWQFGREWFNLSWLNFTAEECKIPTIIKCAKFTAWVSPHFFFSLSSAYLISFRSLHSLYTKPLLMMLCHSHKFITSKYKTMN